MSIFHHQLKHVKLQLSSKNNTSRTSHFSWFFTETSINELGKLRALSSIEQKTIYCKLWKLKENPDSQWKPFYKQLLQNSHLGIVIFWSGWSITYFNMPKIELTKPRTIFEFKKIVKNTTKKYIRREYNNNLNWKNAWLSLTQSIEFRLMLTWDANTK